MDDQYNPKKLVEKFLSDTSQIESSGGQDTDHPTIDNPTSVQYGDTAVGQYGIMPNTVREQLSRLKLKGKLEPDLMKLNKMSNNEIQQELTNNPELQQRFAEEVAKKLYLDTNGDPEKMMYKWNMGTNIPSQSITPEMLDNSAQVHKFRNINRLFKK